MEENVPNNQNNVVVNVNAPTQLTAVEKKINKHIFVWVFAFLLGGLGVDRFMRGQVGVGILKLIFGWCTCGIWWLIDWIIALVKAYSSNSFGAEEEITFVNGKYGK